VPAREVYIKEQLDYCALQRCRCCRFLAGMTVENRIVPPDPRSLAQVPPRTSAFCVCARVPFVYIPSVRVECNANSRTMLYIYLFTHYVIYIPIYTQKHQIRAFLRVVLGGICMPAREVYKQVQLDYCALQRYRCCRF